MRHNNTLLIVDDDIRFRMVIKEMIWSKYPDLEILEAGTIKDAIYEAKRHQPRFIILDIDFDIDNRFQLIRNMKSFDPQVTILALSGNYTLEYKQAVLENGADHFLSKFSYSGKQIIDMVESVLVES